MKKTQWQKMLLAFSLFVFACLLLGGGSRLIASDEPVAPILPADSWLHASLTCPPSTQTNELQQRKTQENTLAVSTVLYLTDETMNPCSPQTDANGNVLRQGSSYMRTVYQAFALGDGFA